jgi:hypothetical protein
VLDVAAGADAAAQLAVIEAAGEESARTGAPVFLRF